jgi:hypothetical protein
MEKLVDIRKKVIWYIWRFDDEGKIVRQSLMEITESARFVDRPASHLIRHVLNLLYKTFIILVLKDIDFCY